MPKSPPSELATAVYAVLLKTVKARATSLTYGELAAALRGAGFVTMYPRSKHMHAALGEVTAACHAHKVPVLPAIVWRSDSARPGEAYFTVAHPAARTEEAKLRAWKREHDRVVGGGVKFPRTI